MDYYSTEEKYLMTHNFQIKDRIQSFVSYFTVYYTVNTSTNNINP